MESGVMERSVFWLPLLASLLHMIEEFVVPGGFLVWHRRYRPELAVSITARNAFVLNALLLAAGLLLGWMGPNSSRGLSLWLTLAALLAGNAVFHLLGALALRRYSPGMVTGVLLYLPLCLWGYGHFVGAGLASPQNAVVSFALGASYQLWSMFHHYSRAKP